MIDQHEQHDEAAQRVDRYQSRTRFGGCDWWWRACSKWGEGCVACNAAHRLSFFSPRHSPFGGCRVEAVMLRSAARLRSKTGGGSRYAFSGSLLRLEGGESLGAALVDQSDDQLRVFGGFEARCG